jgi:hypothetical protein
MEEINKILAAKYFVFYYIDLNVNPKLKDPLIINGKSYLSSISNVLYKDVELRF